MSRIEDTPEIDSGDLYQNARLNEPDGHSPFPIVGIGASAGGLEAFQQLLGQLPADINMAFLLVQHLDATHESHLTHILSRATRLPVSEAIHGRAVRPGEIYVIAPNTCLAVADGLLHVTPRDQLPGPHLPIDHLFRSLALEQQGRAIGVVLSGTGADGTMGLCEIKGAGGITLAQSEASATHAGMPHSAVESGSVDFVLTPDAIARQLAEIASHPYLDPLQRSESVAASDEHYKQIVGAVRAVTKVNFSHYRESTIQRRILRRMALHNQQSMADYARRLGQDATEVEALYRDLLINVTSFFRDPEVFDYLKREVFPQIIKGKGDAPVRIWVPGCSTGQEAYSLAIILWEFFDDRPVRPPIQIFASDMADTGLLEKARAGLFPASIESELEPGRLRRFFKKEDHLYRIDKPIRDACIFAHHNVMADPPFSHVDLISCRNLLIYLDASAQKQVLSTFHYALNVPGFLVLGTAESVSGKADYFARLDREHKVYKKNPIVSHPPMFMAEEDHKGKKDTSPATSRLKGLSADYQLRADRLILAEYGPPGVLINDNFDILQFRGETRPFLSQPPGQPTVNLLRLAREGVFLELRSALTEAKDSNRPVRRERVQLRDEHELREITLRILPIQSGNDERCFLVLFEPALSAAAAVTPSTPAGGWVTRLQRLLRGSEHEGPEASRRSPAAARSSGVNSDLEVERLQRELTAVKEYLQATIEQQDTLSEELRSANEETQSSNEELHSTNEELQTAKEELQSSNQELTTLNEQLRYRNLELSEIGDDLTNLITSTTIPVIMVGNDLRLRRITAPARRVMNLQADYIGRPLRELATNFELPELEGLITEAIDQVQPREVEVRDQQGVWYLLRIHPYRTTENKIDGAVLVLLDINQIKVFQQVQQEIEERLHLALEGGSLGTWYRDLTNGGWSWDDNTNTILGLPAYGERNEVTFFARVHPEDQDKLGVLRNTAEIRDRYLDEIRILQPNGAVRWILLQAKVFYSQSGVPSRLSGICMDITERKELAEKLRRNMEELKQADQRKSEFIAILSHELRNPLAPIINAVEVLRAKDVSETQRDWSREIIDRQVQQMIRIMDDLLDVGRITHEKLSLRREQILLTSVIDNAIETSKPLIDERRQQLIVDLPAERIVLNGDYRRLSQVFSNLLNNAAKYTPNEGRIVLVAKRQDNDAVISIKDNGIGISTELLPDIFDIFVQAKSSHESERGGLGLGLTLVRSLVELHGGTVEAKSEGLGRGSEFVVRIPIGEGDSVVGDQDGAVRPNAQTVGEKGRRILIVDDLAIQAKSLAILLQLRGHDVRIAHNGPDALEILQEFPAEVGLIDIGLPGMDGYSLAGRIREQPQFSKTVLIAQTGWAMEDDRLRSREAGFDYHLAKPIDHDRLHQILTESANADFEMFDNARASESLR